MLTRAQSLVNFLSNLLIVIRIAILTSILENRREQLFPKIVLQNIFPPIEYDEFGRIFALCPTRIC